MAQFALRPLATPRNVAIAAAVLIIGIAVTILAPQSPRSDAPVAEANLPNQARRVGDRLYPASKQWGSLGIEPVTSQVFRTEHLTEGKIAVDEDRATLVFSPYSGRVIKLFAKPGDMVAAGQPLFMVEAPDMVQAQNDFMSAVAGLNKARSALELAKIIENQNKSLNATHAV